MKKQGILILDFGSQYTQLIARRVREMGVYAEIHPHDVSDAFVQQCKPVGIILSGGPESVYDAGLRAPDSIWSLGIPILGICYGMQTMAVQLGGEVVASATHEYGVARILLENTLSALFANVSQKAVVWMSHGDSVSVLPPGFHSLAMSADCPIVAMADETRRLYGIQFHPEVTHTEEGKTIIFNFLFHLCRAQPDWNMGNYVDEAIQNIRDRVGDDAVILGLSGGVDSAVAAALIHRAIGDQLTCVFVDNGLLRLNEAELVMQTFADHLHVKVKHVNASELFLSNLIGVQDPEEKRKIIGRLFAEVFKIEAKKITNATWLAQGTIYPDVIESGAGKTKKAAVIKTHHNVGGLPAELGLQVLEPLRELFKDEVRALGKELGLSETIINRHPFPGPGLGIRILGEVHQEYADILRQADAIFLEELHNTLHTDGKSWYAHTKQAFAVFLPVKSVGVMGDGRTYENVIALRAVQTDDFMTADWAELPYGLIKKVSSRIINEVRGINRVVYDVSSKPPATIEWE